MSFDRPTASDAASTPTSATGAHQPLRHLRIIDMTSIVMGPYCTQILGDMGADVIKVESPDGDLVRQIGPAKHPGMGPIFLNANRSKRSVVIDLKAPEGRALLLRLCEGADIVIYNIRPQAMARLGLGWEDIQAVNPRAIYVGVFGYGQDGPYAARPAYDDLIQSASVLASLFAPSSQGQPRYVPTAMADRVTGLSAVGAVLAAVIERQSSGLGQRIDIPMFETMVAFNLADHMGGMVYDPPLDAGGYGRQLSRFRKPYQTQDGFIAALIFSDKQWRAFFELTQRSDLAADPRFASIASRTASVDEVYAELERILATQTSAHWLRELQRADIPVMPLHDLQSIYSDEHLSAIGFFTTEAHPSEGSIRATRVPSTWSRTQPRTSMPAPRHGEHTTAVLREIGMTPNEIADLAARGVIRSEASATPNTPHPENP